MIPPPARSSPLRCTCGRTLAGHGVGCTGRAETGSELAVALARRPLPAVRCQWRCRNVGQLKDAQYLVFPSGDRPYLLACVRWPDIALAISTHCTAWREDQGLFDLPYEPGAQVVSAGEAAAIAAAWGGELPADSALVDAELALHRRMPANWSHLSPVERRAWLPRRPPVARPPRIAAVQAAPGFAVLE